MNNSRKTQRALAEGEQRWANEMPPYCQDEENDDEHESPPEDAEGSLYEWLDGFRHYEGR